MGTKILLSAMLVSTALLIACQDLTAPDKKVNIESAYAGFASVPKGQYGLFLASNTTGQPDSAYDYLFLPYRSGEITNGGMHAMIYTIDPLVLSKFRFNIPSDAVIKNVTVKVWGYTESENENTVWASLLSGQDTIASTAANMATGPFTTIAFPSNSISPATISDSLRLRLVVNSPMYVDAVQINVETE